MKSNKLRAIIFVLLAILLSFIVACGQKGHLYIPDETQMTNIMDLLL